jgi:hypothetical protein
MSVEVTTVGPLSYDTRDDLREYADERGLNYNEAIKALLEEAGA